LPPLRRSNQLKGLRPGRRRRPRRVRARPRPARRLPGVQGSARGRDPTSARGRRPEMPKMPAMTARPRRPPGRLRLPRPCPGPRLTARRTALRSARPRPMAPPRTGRQVPGRPTRRPAGCPRFLSRLRPGPGLNPAPPDPSRRLRGLRAFPAPRGCRDRRGPRLPRPTSVARRPVKGVRAAKGARQARPGPRLPAPARRAAQGGSARPPPQAVLTRVARAPGRPHRGPRDLVRPGRVRLGQADPVRARVLRVPVRGRATTRSAQPRLVWGRRLRRGLRVPARLVSPAVPVLRPAARAVLAAQGVRVQPGAVPVGPACPTVARAPAGSRARVPAAPVRAR
jgi:hypothetical protein